MEEKSQTHSNTLTRQLWAWMTNRLSDFDIPELTHTRTHTHACKYELTSLFYSWQKIFLTYKHTPLYIAQIYEHCYLFIFYLSSCDKVKLFNILVAVTYVFPLANQCPRQAIRLHTDQSGAERIDSFFLSKTIFVALFGSRPTVRENPCSKERPLSRPLLWTFHMEDLHRRAHCY